MTADFFAGFVFCMIADCAFAVVNFFVQRALRYRAQRRRIERGDDLDD